MLNIKKSDVFIAYRFRAAQEPRLRRKVSLGSLLRSGHLWKGLGLSSFTLFEMFAT